ncbi:acylphosphatase [Ovoidimarina sediminis]|uniref:acylphosphatase n=1 Tax=Ovoidimarina sediminis TaxID=3079856 RepID=UPI002911B7BB|nr:acylphosphatase [Rhodophyticola sp. MJ-SS7]MDU8942808.1 acylphosphatase [Rhodophyticola sp. MJ-SS7]
MTEVAVFVRVAGRVQGVAFRAWTRETARKLGVRGWVENCADGSVAAHLEGREEAVQAMLAAMHEGPRHAAVHGLETEPSEPVGCAGFEILR